MCLPWGVTLGLQGFLDTNMLVLATPKSHIGGIAHREFPCEGFPVAVEYRLFTTEKPHTQPYLAVTF